jgi:dTDP-4-amino-4,6-dideoxygalactose transaminase
MRVPLLDLTRELRHIGAAVKEQWDQLLEHPQFINGEQVRSFEHEMATFLDVSHVVGIASGTEALILGLAACGIGEGDEVILPRAPTLSCLPL